MNRWLGILALFLFAPVAAFGATAVFQQPLRLDLPAPGPTGGEWVGTADFDGDGHADMLIQSDAALSVHLGNGDMSFDAPVVTDPGDMNASRGMALGYVNSDGIPDAAVIDTSNQVLVLLGNGGGGFTTAATLVLGTKTRGVVIGEFTGDAHADVFANSNDTIFVFPGNGDGTFGSALTSTTTGSLFGDTGIRGDVVSGDFNDDGDLDVAVAAETAGAFVIQNNGSGTFVAPVQFDAVDARTIAAGDFNGDGRDDVATLRGTGTPIGLTYLRAFTQNASGSLVLKQDSVTGETSDRLAAADLDGDGHLDLVSASAEDAMVTVHRGNGSGGFTATHYLTMNRSSLLTIADYSGDDHPDVLQYDALILGSDDGTLRTPLAYNQSSAEVALGRVNGDTVPDLVTFTEKADKYFLTVRLGNGDGTFGAPAFFNTSIHPTQEYGSALGDINGDGFLDALVGSKSPTVVFPHTGNGYVVFGNGAGGFTGPVISTTSFPAVNQQEFELIDVDGDGDDDFVYVSNGVTVRKSNGDGTFGAATMSGPGGGITANAVFGFIDGDDNLDLVSGETIWHGVDQVNVQRFGSFNDFSHDLTGTYLALVDLNGDGGPDLLSRNESTGNLELRLWTSVNSIIRFGPPRVLAFDGEGQEHAADFFRPVKPGDVDGDGNVDLISRGTSVLLGDGNGWFKDFQTYHDISPLGDFDAADLDGNDTTDIAVLAGSKAVATSGIGVLLTELGPTFDIPVTVELSSTPNPSTHNEPVTLTATKTPTPGFVPQGAVLFDVDGVLAGVDPFSTGEAAEVEAGIFAGTRTVTATYPLDDHFAADGDSLVQDVAKGTQTITITADPQFAADPGTPVTFTATVAVETTGSITFKDNGVGMGTVSLVDGVAQITTSTLTPSEHTITAEHAGDAFFHPSTGSLPYEIGIPMDDGFAITATTIHSALVRVDWPAITGAKFHEGVPAYRLFRGTTTSNLQLVATFNKPGPFNDSNVIAGNAYVYRVVASGASDSATSAFDLASTVVHADEPLATGVTKVKLAHVTTLRQAMNGVRAATGLAAFNFSDPPAPAGPIRASHLTELRTALSQALAVIGQSIAFTDPTITPGVTPLKAVHWQELRNGLK